MAGSFLTFPKRCRHCGQVKESSEFYRHPGTADGLNSWCRACKGKADRERRRRGAVSHVEVPGRCCSKCGVYKPLSAFTPCRATSIGVSSWCKPCNAARTRAFVQRVRKRHTTGDTVVIPETKRCYRCGQTKDILEFGRSRRRKDGLTDECRVCLAAYQRRYRRKKRDHTE